MAEKSGSVDFLAGFLVGGLVGAAAALLFAPQSGEETRTLIRDKGIELKEQADEASAQARKKAEELQVQAKHRAEELQVQAKQRAEELQAQVKHAVEEGKSAAAASKQDMLTKLDEEAASGTSAAVEEIDITEIIEE